jgi:arsenical pump membrane protein
VHGAAAETVAVLLLAVTLAVALLRPFGISEAFVAAPAAGLIVALGVVPSSAAAATLRSIGPTVGFLAAILVFGHLCAEAGVFDYLGGIAARASGGRPARLLTLGVALAAAITAVLTLDATVVLLTPVILTTVATLRVAPHPHTLASTRLANSASVLLPVSNLTNLLAFAVSGLTFARFAALMTLPWLLICAAELLLLRSAFDADLSDTVRRVPNAAPAAPAYALIVLAATVAGFVGLSAIDASPAWAALAGCIALLLPRLRARSVRPSKLIAEANPGFCAFVLCLAVIVDGVDRHGLNRLLHRTLPSGTGLLAMLAITLIAALLANLLNNLPATLALLPLVAGSPAQVLAVLIGVNVGPNATYPGSLATLLWRRIVPAEQRPSAARFHAVGLASAVPLLVLAASATWLSIALIGTG